VSQPEFAQSFDAQDWAAAFCDRFTIIRVEDEELMDEGLMIGWFANAIMRGWDEHERRISYEQWLEVGTKHKFCSEPVCNTHNGLPSTEEEDAMWEDGGDPCVPAVRLYP
jgi:hypothetical protein